MTFLKAAPTVLCAAIIATAFSPSVKADEWNQKTVITFSQPVETPGVHIKGWAVLPAGTYVFKLLDSPSDRHIVQIFNQDETVLYATVLAIPNYRLRATGKTVLTFSRDAARPAGRAPGMVLSRQKLWRGVRISEGKSARAGQSDQHAGSLHACRDPGRGDSADHVSRRAGGGATETSAGSGSDAHWRRRSASRSSHRAARRSAGSDE
jgi:hypothetical protein